MNDARAANARGAPDGTSARALEGTSVGASNVSPDRTANGPAWTDGEPFAVSRPAEQRIPFVVNSPHSGRSYPEAFLRRSRLDARAVRRSEDAWVDLLLSEAVPLGAPVLQANFPRAWLDVNREPFELDPAMFDGPLPAHANSRSIRVAGGLGTIPRVVAEGQPIYAGRLSVREGLRRIEEVYRPYHETLRRLMARTCLRFGYAVLLDCHSMPSAVGRGAGGGARPDVVVGDRYGTSCAPALSRALMDAFAARGYRTTRNKPYAGGFITEHYGRPLKGLHAVQIEINRALYMDETTLEPGAGFEALREDLGAVLAEVSARPDRELYPLDEGDVDVAAQ